jgi:hypothetical protein
MRERSERGRTASGERNGRAKVTVEMVRRMRAMDVPGRVPSRVLAAQFGVSGGTVRRILNRTIWRGVEPVGGEEIGDRRGGEAERWKMENGKWKMEKGAAKVTAGVRSRRGAGLREAPVANSRDLSYD